MLFIEGLLHTVTPRRFAPTSVQVWVCEFHLASDYGEPILGLIGADLIQFIKELKIVQCMHWSAFSIANGIS